MDPFLSWLLGQAGLNARAYQAAALQRRLPACLRALRAPSPQAAQSILERQPELLPKAISAVLIGVTEFFRDATVFDDLRQSIFPELLKVFGGLKILSAGCSTGQELYSTAMLLHDLRALQPSVLWGVDCRSDAIEKARSGLLHERELSGLTTRQIQCFFESQGGWHRIIPDLQSSTRWRLTNLLTHFEDESWDVIFCRNLVIYLSCQEAAALWTHLVKQLKVGGILVTGKAERPPQSLPLKRMVPCIYRRAHE